MTKTLSWHSTLATDRPRYHDDTRCPEGDAIALKDRRPGDGGRDPCEHCAGLLIETIAARLLPPGTDRPRGGGSSSVPV
jgi:hypothetical protein